MLCFYFLPLCLFIGNLRTGVTEYVIFRSYHPVPEKLTKISEYLMSTTVVLFLKSEFKSEIAKSGSDEYQAFQTIVSSTIYRWLRIVLLWTECIYVHLNNNTFPKPETHNREFTKNSGPTTASQALCRIF